MMDSDDHDINISRLASFELEIVRFYTVLDRIQDYFLEETRIWDFIANTREWMFRLQQAMRGLDMIDFTSSSADPWIDLQCTNRWGEEVSG